MANTARHLATDDLLLGAVTVVTRLVRGCHTQCYMTAACSTLLLACSTTPTGERIATVSGPQRLVVTNDTAYVSTNGDGVAVDLDSGATQVVVQAGGDRVALWAVDESALYASRASPTTQVVFQQSRDGSAATVLASGEGPLAIDDAFVYFVSASAIQRVAKQGGAQQTIATFDDPTRFGVSSLLVDDTYVYWSVHAAYDGSVSSLSSLVERAPKLGGPAGIIGANGANVTSLAQDATHVYWLATGDELIRFDKSTEAIDAITGGLSAFGLGLTAGAGGIYWLGPGCVMHAEGDSSTGVVVALTPSTSQTGPVEIAATASAILWLTLDDRDSGVGSVMRLKVEP